MELFVPAAATLGLASLILLSAMWLMRRRGASHNPHRAPHELDTVVDWAPQAVCIMTLPQRRAFDLVRRALPKRAVLAQVPLARFISVAPGQPYREWLTRVGRQNVDLVVCDSRSRAVAAIEVRAASASPRSIQRYQSMVRVLEAAGVPVHVWSEDDLPSLAQVRQLLSTRSDGTLEADSAGALPLPEIHELLAEGDALDAMAGMEPVPSTFYTQLDGPLELPQRGLR
jgi:hypothetical protein